MSVIPAKQYGAILADPPWAYRVWNDASEAGRRSGTAASHYATQSPDEIAALPVSEWAKDDCALFCWATWPSMPDALKVIQSWGFTYKTCAFCWVKGNSLPLFPEDFKDRMGLGHWTRANSEVCLMATRGRPKRLHADVRQVIQAPVRQHSRKPDEQYERIERLVDGPYLEMFARQRRPGWDAWGNETEKFGEAAE